MVLKSEQTATDGSFDPTAALMTAKESGGTLSFKNVVVSCAGDIRTLIKYTDYKNANTSDARFCYLFYGCKNLTSIPEKLLPATTLAEYCYSSMFKECNGLTTIALELPAEILAANCYEYMFSNCMNLQTAPKLPATTLAEYCYDCMFYGCTKLQTAPEMPATALVVGCYKNMFNGCNALNAVTIKATGEIAINALDYWLYGVASCGVINKKAGLSLAQNSSSGIPSDWTTNEITD